MPAGKRWWRLIGLLVLLSISAVSGHEELEEPGEHSHPSDNQLGTYKHVWPMYDNRFPWGSIWECWRCRSGWFFHSNAHSHHWLDQKSSNAVSKCMITGTSTATVLYNLRRRHPTLELPIIDYDLALLFQPLLVLGISIGVSLNAVLSDWMITILLFVVLLGVSAKSFIKGIEAWKKETMTKENILDASRHSPSNGVGTKDVEARCTPGCPSNYTLTQMTKAKPMKVSVLQNVCWKVLGVIVGVWLVIRALQIAKNYLIKCSVAYWLTEFLQIPVAVGVTSYQAMNLYRGRSVIALKGEADMKWSMYKLVVYCSCGIAAGMLGGLLGLGGAFLLGPIFLEMGIPPQVSSATATFAMTFSSFMSVVEYYLLKRFPIPYALYFAAVSTISAFAGQKVARKGGKEIRKSFFDYLHPGIHSFCEFSNTRWDWHRKHDHEDSTQGLLGVSEHLHLQNLVGPFSVKCDILSQGTYKIQSTPTCLEKSDKLRRLYATVLMNILSMLSMIPKHSHRMY